MKRSPPAVILFGAVGAAILSLASAAEMKHTPPANVNLAGLWLINPDLSDDAHKLVEKKRRESAEGGRSRGGGVPSGTSIPGPGGIIIEAGDILGGVLGGGTSSGSRGGGRSGGAGDRPPGDPEPSTMKAPLDAFLATVDQFEITQQPDSLTIATVDEKTTCKPADPGEAPVPGGDLGKRKCGWQGDTWVTEVTAPNGVIRTNRYELKNGGKQLVMTSEIKGGKSELAGLRIKRVYERAL